MSVHGEVLHEWTGQALRQWWMHMESSCLLHCPPLHKQLPGRPMLDQPSLMEGCGLEFVCVESMAIHKKFELSELPTFC